MWLGLGGPVWGKDSQGGLKRPQSKVIGESARVRVQSVGSGVRVRSKSRIEELGVPERDTEPGGRVRICPEKSKVESKVRGRR